MNGPVDPDPATEGASLRQIAWLVFTAVLGSSVLVTGGDASTLGLVLLVLYGPMLLLVDPGFRQHAIRMEQRFWRRWRGSSVFDTGVRAVFVAPFYSFLLLAAAVVHVPAAAARLRRWRAARRDSTAPRTRQQSEAMPRARRPRIGRVVLLYVLLYIGVFATFWSNIAADPSRLMDAPLLTGTNLLFQLAAIAPALYVRDPGYRAKFGQAIGWLRDQWRATPGPIRIVLLVFALLSGFLFIAALYVPTVVLVQHLRGAGDPPPVATDAPAPASEVRASSMPDEGQSRESQESKDPTGAVASPPRGPGSTSDEQPMVPPRRPSWGGGGGGGSVG